MTIERIGILAPAPWITTAYGQQAAQLAAALKDEGYQVAIFAYAGLLGTERTWRGITVYPAGRVKFGQDVVASHARRFGADLVLILTDSFALDPLIIQAMTEERAVAYWCPIDAIAMDAVEDPLPVLYQAVFMGAPAAVPIAMSRFGQRLLEQAGHDALYVPHMIDTDVFRPQDRAEVRARRGIPEDAFIIGMNAANSDTLRKNFPGQMAAWKRARKPGWQLWLHTDAFGDMAGGLDLRWEAASRGIYDDVYWPDPDDYVAGRIDTAQLADWYACLDLYSQCSLAEGFGITPYEAQACGIPVVVTDGSAMTESCGAGWAIPGEPITNPALRAEWVLPLRTRISQAYKRAAANPATLAALAPRARTFAGQYAIPHVMDTYWKPALKALEERQ